MSTFANAPYWMFSKSRTSLIRLGKSSFLGCASCSINARSRNGTEEVIWHPPCRRRYSTDHFYSVFKSLSTSGSQVMAMRHSTLQSSSTRANYGHLLGLSLEADSPSQKIATLSAPPSPSETDQDDSSSPTSFRMGVVIHENPTGQCGRANNLPTLLELNRKVSPRNTLLATFINII